MEVKTMVMCNIIGEVIDYIAPKPTGFISELACEKIIKIARDKKSKTNNYTIKNLDFNKIERNAKFADWYPRYQKHRLLN